MAGGRSKPSCMAGGRSKPSCKYGIIKLLKPSGAYNIWFVLIKNVDVLIKIQKRI